LVAKAGDSGELWLAPQTRYDLDRLGKSKRPEIAAIPTLAAQ